MFFFIGGVQPKTVTLKRRATACSVCGYPEVHLKRIDHYLSLFFIPLFPVKKGSPFWVCESCVTMFDERGTPLTVHTQQDRINCPHCGRPVYADYSFCPYCGRKLRDAFPLPK